MACGWDLACLVLDFPRARQLQRRRLAGLARRLGSRRATRPAGRAAVLATLPECLPESVAEALIAAGIVPLLGIDDALAAAEAAADIGAAQAGTAARAPAAAPDPGRRGGHARRMAGQAAPGRASACRIPAAGWWTIRRQAVAWRAELGYPVVVKAVGAALAHKSELGAVALDLRDAGGRRGRGRAHGAVSARRSWSSRWSTDGVAELIVGVVRDPQVGLCLVLGSGGVLVELAGRPRAAAAADDRRRGARGPARAEGGAAAGGLPWPAGRRCRRRGRGGPGGGAGSPPRHADRLVELDVNPLIVRPAGKGAVAADVLIRLAADGASA